MKEKIRALFSILLKIPEDEISDNLSPDDVEEWDSLNHLVLISAFEDEFSIDIEPEEIIEMNRDYKTFKSIILKKLG